MPFILIVIGVILVVLNYKALKKDETSFCDMLKYKQKDMTEVEVEIGAIRRDIAESLTELQKEILDIKDKALDSLLKHLIKHNDKYIKEDVIRACMGGKMILEDEDNGRT